MNDVKETIRLSRKLVFGAVCSAPLLLSVLILAWLMHIGAVKEYRHTLLATLILVSSFFLLFTMITPPKKKGAFEFAVRSCLKVNIAPLSVVWLCIIASHYNWLTSTPDGGALICFIAIANVISVRVILEKLEGSLC